MPVPDWTYTLALLFPKAMELTPPPLFMIFAHQELADGYHYNEGQNPGQQEGDEEGLLFYNFRAEGGSGCIKPVHKGRIFHRACFIKTGG